MLLVFLQDCDRAQSLLLKDTVQVCLYQSDMEARIAYWGQKLDMELPQSAAPALFVLATGQGSALDALVRRIRKHNPANYLVLLLKDQKDLFALIPPFYRPSGFLLRPVDEASCGRVLREIYHDFRKSCLEDGQIFVVKIKNCEYPLSYEKILYFESANKKIIVRTGAQQFTFYGSMEAIENAAPDHFLRIHKSFTVNLRQIKHVDYSAMTVTMCDDSMVFLSRSYKTILRERMRGGPVLDPT